MAKRRAGGLMFADVLDRDEKVQFYLKRDEIGEEEFNRFKLEIDVWDVIGAEGVVFRTAAGEISINVSSFTLLAKNLFIPVKANEYVKNEVSDHDIRYRQRYMDLIANPSVRETFKKRSAIIREIRNYLDSLDFLEVDTPVLNSISGGATAKPFITHHNALDIDMYLRIATELNLKRLIVGGLERVYEMGRQFRNEGMDLRHNPEFTTIEIYQAYTDYEGMMRLTEGLVSTVCEKVNGTTKITYNGNEYDLTAPWPRMTMKEAVKKYSGIDFDALESVDEAIEAVRAAGIDPEGKSTMGELIALVFEEKSEDNLTGPIFITEYPVEVSPLAKRMPTNKAFAERFEVFVAGSELGNAFSELNDPDDQKERFEAQVAAREAGDEEAGMMDEDYINALRYGMPPTGGVGIGIDRLVMLLTDNPSIRDVLLFPTMKPKD
jgi:lysyl-tRNA synthetase class 2